MPKPKAKTLKLYVWTDYCPDYTSGLAFAVAYSQQDAELQIQKACGYPVHEWGTLTIHSLKHKIAYEISGGG